MFSPVIAESVSPSQRLQPLAEIDPVEGLPELSPADRRLRKKRKA
jgi:hypothetical protein